VRGRLAGKEAGIGIGYTCAGNVDPIPQAQLEPRVCLRYRAIPFVAYARDCPWTQLGRKSLVLSVLAVWRAGGIRKLTFGGFLDIREAVLD
jgi:hypothetical protein